MNYIRIKACDNIDRHNNEKESTLITYSDIEGIEGMDSLHLLVSVKMNDWQQLKIYNEYSYNKFDWYSEVWSIDIFSGYEYKELYRCISKSGNYLIPISKLSDYLRLKLSVDNYTNDFTIEILLGYEWE
jgi:hypothetical protein